MLHLGNSVLVLASCMGIATAQSVHLFGDTNFGLSTGHWLFEFSMAQFCVNAVAFIDKASSAQWRDLPQAGGFANNQSFIAFYTDRNCTGTVRTWPTAEKDFPTNFALNGIDNQISSFMVWKTSDKVGGIAADPTYLLL
ncbi:hypothetical protein PHYPSEUDO_011030 [Phytophthora pseudosyringae]|uniref:Uncharacterized protein n=1 Tax=Phytophthora pseudosyringae TaxID=221518 RepID=A0A8T1V9U8_9STRA|nr:hypothetical protein PHYPSEUDO_011030 [Phytophthora pseudosyringae]